MKIAIVTGASSGMGREFVTQLSNYVQVDEIWAIARREQALASLREESKIPVRPISLDLCKEESFSALAELLAREQPDVKLLVNAAGFGKFGALDTDEDWACEARRYYFGIVGKYGIPVQNLLKKAENLDKKDEILNNKIKEADAIKEQINDTLKEQTAVLEKLSGLSAGEAKEYLLKNMESLSKLLLK